MWAECSLLGFCTLILILIWLLVFNPPIFQILVFYVHFGGGKTISGRCWDNVRPIFTSWPARALKFWGLSQNGLRNMFKECLLFVTMSGPCLDHFGTMIDLALLTDQLQLWNFQDLINMVWILFLCSVFFLGACQVDVWTMVGPANPYYYPFPRPPLPPLG